jgi:predicted component of type VI protein secretion system
MRGDRSKTKFIHILSFDNKNQIVLGRSNDCDLSFPELTVSRYHCLIHKDKNKLYLEDNNSKFGTLVLLQNPNILMIDNSPLRLQTKRVYLKIKLLIHSNIFSCCNANTFDSKIYSYQAQNQKYFDIMSSFVIKNDNSDLNENDIESEENDRQKVDDNEIIYLKNNDLSTGRGIEKKKF